MIGSISFGIDLVAGRKRVPRPAAGISAFLIVKVNSPMKGNSVKLYSSELKYFSPYNFNFSLISVQSSILHEKELNLLQKIVQSINKKKKII
jgi:hypothetical protein